MDDDAKTLKDGEIVWAKLKRHIFWPAKVVLEKEDDKDRRLVNFFDEDTWEEVGSSVKVCCWNCEKHDSYVKKGEKLPKVQERLSFNRAVASAMEAFGASPKQGSKKNGVKTKKQPESASYSKGKAENSLDSLESSNSPDSIAKMLLENDDDDDDFPEAFSPVRKTSDLFVEGELVWAKFRREPYWPAVFHSLSKPTAKRKLANALVWFIDETWNIKNLKRHILPVPKRKVVSYYCDPSLREQFEKEGKEYKHAEQFKQCLKFAESFNESLALGKLKNFFTYEESEDEEIDEDNSKEKCKKDETISYKRRSLNFKDVLAKYTSDRAKRGSTARQKYKDLLAALNNTRPMLEKIYKEEIPCERHKIFFQGSTQERNLLKYRSGFGPIQDEKMMDELLKKLCKWFDDCNTREAVNSVTYVCDVWLPEAMILALMESKKISREVAEQLYHNPE